jgi:hypothetical protein
MLERATTTRGGGSAGVRDVSRDRSGRDRATQAHDYALRCREATPCVKACESTPGGCQCAGVLLGRSPCGSADLLDDLDELVHPVALVAGERHEFFRP